MRLIDADALKRDVCKYCNDVYSDEPCEPSDCEHMRIIDNQPTIDAVEVVHGTWESYPSNLYRRCSACKVEYDAQRFNVRARYCPNCGASMQNPTKDGWRAKP